MKNYPAVNKLIAAVREHQFTFSFPATKAALAEQFYVRLAMHRDGKTVSLPVMDEYEDVPVKKPVVLLQLILQECELYEEAEDFETWAADVGLNPKLPITSEIYEELSEKVPIVREIAGNLRAISLHDMEFNTGAAQALRNAKV